MSKTRRIILGLVISVPICLAIFIAGRALMFHSPGGMNRERVLRSLPEPPGLQKETDLVEGRYSYPEGYRIFDVKGNYADVVAFFKAEFPLAGWRLLEEKENPPNPQQDDFVQSLELLFSGQDRYCLQVTVGTSTNQQGSQEGDRVWVDIVVVEESDCHFY